MSTLTKEWLQKTIAELEEERDAVPAVVNEDATNALAAMKLALASLEAEPLGYIDAEYAELLKSGHIESCSVYAEPGEGCITLFTAPPVSVSEREPAQMFGIGSVFKPQILSGDEVDCDNCAHYQPNVCHGEGCPAAMLQGAEPVTTAYKLPAEAAYGYFAFNDHHGEEFFKNREDAIAFCKEAIEDYRQENAEEGCDPDEVRRTCWGIIMQEGTDFEVDSEGHIDYALTPELDGNSPVIPDDVRRMDWLVSKTIDVREPMAYGSHSLFWSQTITDEEDDFHATKLREQIDAAMEAERAAVPQQEVKP